MEIKIYSEQNEDILSTNEPKLALISYSGETAVIGLLDEGVEHHILLEKAGLDSRSLDKYFRIIFDDETADWTFVCPVDYKGITNREKRIKAFYNDGFTAISHFLSEIDYFCDINIPKRYRRHFNALGD
ncbi:MAG: hypothetical protein IKS17_01055 [Firmicutes bacterium]|nr:hypothetical protein [Bacillota bacterium]